MYSYIMCALLVRSMDTHLIHVARGRRQSRFEPLEISGQHPDILPARRKVMLGH